MEGERSRPYVLHVCYTELSMGYFFPFAHERLMDRLRRRHARRPVVIPWPIYRDGRGLHDDPPFRNILVLYPDEPKERELLERYARKHFSHPSAWATFHLTRAGEKPPTEGFHAHRIDQVLDVMVRILSGDSRRAAGRRLQRWGSTGT